MSRVAGLLLLTLGVLSAPATAEAPEPWIAIIIDDLGNDRAAGTQVVGLPGPVTLSLLPQTAYAPAIARAGMSAGKEVMLHVPMESSRHRPLGPGALTGRMTAPEVAEVMDANLSSVPGVVGVNNHMGSLMTRQPAPMRRLMRWLQRHDGLYFVDSRTDRQTIAESMAHEMGVPAARRDVFLDNDRDPDRIAERFRELLWQAHKHGAAIGIGHPYDETLAVLQRELPRLDDYRVRLVPVSRIIERQQDQDRQEKVPTWHAYLSRLLQDTRISKPSP